MSEGSRPVASKAAAAQESSKKPLGRQDQASEGVEHGGQSIHSSTLHVRVLAHRYVLWSVGLSLLTSIGMLTPLECRAVNVTEKEDGKAGARTTLKCTSCGLAASRST